MSERMTQAQWDKNRAKVKAKAAKVVKANAEKAAAAKREALGQPPLAKVKESKAEAKEPETGEQKPEGTESGTKPE
jgi:hypothetical protein